MTDFRAILEKQQDEEGKLEPTFIPLIFGYNDDIFLLSIQAGTHVYSAPTGSLRSHDAYYYTHWEVALIKQESGWKPLSSYIPVLKEWDDNYRTNRGIYSFMPTAYVQYVFERLSEKMEYLGTT